MKYLGVLLFVIYSTCVGWTQQLKPSIDTLKKHVYYFSSQELKGRNTGAEGQKIAAGYILKRFREYGLIPWDGTNFYDFYNLKKKHSNYLVVKSSGSLLFWPWHFYFTSGYTQTDTLNTSLVFIGYGSDKEIEGLNLKNKALVLLAKDPKEAYKQVIDIKKKYGNRTFFMVFPSKNNDVDRVWGDEYALASFEIPKIFDARLSQTITDDWVKPKDSVNIFYCFPNVLRNFFMLDDKELEKLANSNKSTDYSLLTSAIQPKVQCILSYNDSIEEIDVENVGGIIKGKDTTKTIVVTAHFDHIGEELGRINYGADDNASGTSALLEVARLMSDDVKNGILPETNVLFLAFSGEELGLLGSEAFLTDEKVDLSELYLNINMDMVGRWDERHEKKRSFVYLLTAGDNSKKLFKVGKRSLNLPKEFEVSNKPGAREKMVFRYGSDHYSFLKRDIPVAVFFTGLHDDYHTPRDIPEKINYKNLTDITDMVYQYIYKVSELQQKAQ